MRDYLASGIWPYSNWRSERRVEDDIGWYVDYTNHGDVECKACAVHAPETLVCALQYDGFSEIAAVHAASWITRVRRRRRLVLFTCCDLDCRRHPRPTKVRSLCAVGCVPACGC